VPEQLDYYEVLEISPKAEASAIYAAYRRLAQKYHPDVNPEPAAHERMSELNEAREVLGDPAKRAEYDLEREAVLAERALASKPATFVFPPAPAGAAASWGETLRRPVTWLTIAGAASVALATIAAIAMPLGGGDGDSGGETSAQADAGGDAGAPRRERALAAVAPPAGADATPTEAPSPTPSPEAAPSTTPPALAASDAPRSGRGRGAPSAAVPPPAPSGAGAPAPAPVTPASAPPATNPSAPQTPVPPGQCSLPGPPQYIENGNEVIFSGGDVLTFQSGDEDVLLVRVAGRTVRLELDDETEVRGDLDGATVVNGLGRRAGDGTIEARTVEVVCGN
jgi:curved DNA-binding protein CbpA